MAELLSGLQVQSWWRAPSGLILPCSVRDQVVPTPPPGKELRYEGLLWAERRDPLPNIAAYATPEALNVKPLPFDEFRGRLTELPQNVLLPILSDLQSRLSTVEHNREKELRLAEMVFGRGHVLDRLSAFVANGPGRRTIFSEQALTLLQWLAIADCNEAEVLQVGADEAAQVRRCVLGVSSYLEAASRDLVEESRTDRWLRHLTQNFTFNSRPVVGNAMGRTWAILGRLHRQSDALLPRVDIDAWLAEDYGLSLEQQMAVGFALYAHLSAGTDDAREFTTLVAPENLEAVFAGMRLSGEERNSALRLISAPLSRFRDEIDGKTLEQLSWDQVPFMRHPLIEMPDGYYLLHSPRALIAWMVDGAYYRVLDSARDRGERAVSAFTSRIGKLTEGYVLELVRSAHPEPRLPVTGKAYGDKTYGRGAHSSDVTIAYPHEAVLIEVSSHRLSLQAKRDGDIEALRHDLTEMVGRRPKQLRRCIDAIKPRQRGRQATLRFSHLDPTRLERIWPIIITSLPLHWSPVLEDFVGPELQQLESRPEVEALDVMAVEDLEGLLAIYEHTGRTLSELLAAKVAALGPRADVRTWVDRDRSVPNLARPHYLDAALTEILDITARLFGLEGLDEDEESTSAA